MSRRIARAFGRTTVSDLIIRAALIGALFFGSAVLFSTGAVAQIPVPGTGEREVAGPPVDIVTADGPIDPVVARYLIRRIEAAESSGSQVVILQIDTPGGLGSEAKQLVEKVASSKVPVVVWVGPGGARAASAGAYVYLASSLRAVGPGARVGKAEPFDLRDPVNPDASEELASLARLRSSEARLERFARSAAEGGALGGEAAVAQGVADYLAPTVGDAVVGLDGMTALVSPEARIVDGIWVSGEVREVRLATARVVAGPTGEPRREPVVEVRLHRLSFVDRILHSVSGTSVAYLLLLAGLLLIVFEFYTSGIGLAGAAGMIFVALASYGLSVVGFSPGVMLIGLAFVLLASDIQSGVRGWSTYLGGAVLFLALALIRLTYSPVLRPPIWVLVVYFILTLAAFRLGIAVMVRSRYWAPSIDRQLFSGREAEVREPLRPRGTARVGRAIFAARSEEGEMFRGEKGWVAGVDGTELVISSVPPFSSQPVSGGSGNGAGESVDAEGG